MDEEIGAPEDLKAELKRLRAAVKRVVELEVNDPKFTDKFDSIKVLVQGALSRVDTIRSDRAPWLDLIRKKAIEGHHEAKAKRYAEILAEIAEIEAEEGRMLKPYTLAARMNARGKIHPFRGIYWNEATIRAALKFAGRV